MTSQGDVAIIVVAAGSGTRLGAGVPKAFAALGGMSILRHALRSVFAAPPAQVIVVAPDGWEGHALRDAWSTADEADLRSPLPAGNRRELIAVVRGGETRQESVHAGLRALGTNATTVLVHDAARALTPPEVFERVAAAVRQTRGGVIPAVPVVDTIKRVSDGVGSSVLAAVDRSVLAAAQTPQGFPRQELVLAYAQASADHTDDAALMAASGIPVITVAGDARAFKITTADDLDRAQALIGAAPPQLPGTARVGVGTDVHGFGGSGTLWLAGLEWPGEQALSGHSDGDAVSHAMVDALLSAAGLGDIGTHFGTDRPEFAGAHAEAFLSHTHALVREAGWEIGNVSVQVQANRPRFALRRVEAERVLSEALGGASVSVSATTTDGLGFTGRGEGVAAFAVALLVPR